jgi:hypothetical protein
MNATSAPSAPGAGLLVDQPDAAPAQMRQRRVDVVDAQGHVVHAGPALLEIFRDRRIRRGRLEHLEGRLPGVENVARTRCDAISSLARRAGPARP